MKEKESSLIVIAILAGAYIGAQLLADIGSLRIVLLGRLSMDAGTLVYPITFTLRDLIHKAGGKKTAQTIVILAAVINVIMAVFFSLVAWMKPDLTVGAQTEFAIVLAPVWRLVIASIIAEVVGELIDTEMYQIWIEKVTTKHEWARVLVSNAVSVPVDSLIFVWAAFGGVMPVTAIWAIFASNLVLKGITTMIGLPLIYLVNEKRVDSIN